MPVSQTEPEAREKYGDDQIKVYKSTFTALYYSMMDADHKEPTAMKLICAGKEEKVVGLHLIGLGSDEMLQGFAVAVKMGGTCTRTSSQTSSPSSKLLTPSSLGPLPDLPLLSSPPLSPSLLLGSPSLRPSRRRPLSLRTPRSHQAAVRRHGRDPPDVVRGCVAFL